MIVPQPAGDLLVRPALREIAFDQSAQARVPGELRGPRPARVTVAPKLPAPGPIATPTAAECPDLPHHRRGRPPESSRDRPVRLARLQPPADLLALTDREPERRSGDGSRAQAATRRDDASDRDAVPPDASAISASGMPAEYRVPTCSRSARVTFWSPGLRAISTSSSC